MVAAAEQGVAHAGPQNAAIRERCRDQEIPTTIPVLVTERGHCVTELVALALSIFS